jgi:hypothetical protein
VTGGDRESRPRAPGAADNGIRLLWFTGAAAVALTAAAFVIWMRNGAGILLDMVLALCL